MKKISAFIPRWLPALFMMAAIFAFSSQPGDNLPDFFGWDYVVKKGGHVAGYALLALAYFHWLRYDKRYYRLAWALAVLYAATDEFHQSFVPGRSPSMFDALVFDNAGALLGLWLYQKISPHVNS